MERARTSGSLVHSVANALAFGVLVVACDEYTPPCTVVRDDPGLTRVANLFPGANTLSFVADPDGTVTAIWLVSTPGDASTSSTLGSAPSAPVGAEVAVVGSDGDLSSRSSFAAPGALAKRVGSIPFVGLSWTGEGALFLWVEEVDGTLPSGESTVAQTLKLQFVGCGWQQWERHDPRRAAT
jgi:hypothetical protein